jgi:short-subunit dehydrogenase
MGVSLKPLNQQVMVITGASSGIGLATARMAAQRGASVVLAARDPQALAAAERELRDAGYQAMSVVTDVRKHLDLDRLAEAAVGRFGRIDTWVNNAGTSIFGKLEEISEEDHRALFETNFWGVVYGSLTALKHLKPHGGALINLGSVASDMAIPLQSMYSATKHAIKGFTDGLRMELEAEGAPVSVTLIKPTSIDTPFPQRARNYMDVQPKLPEPVYAPEDVAESILHAATTPVRDQYVGTTAPAMGTAQTLMPRTMDWFTEAVMAPRQRTNEPPRDPHGTLHEPGHGGHVHGKVGAKPRRWSGLTAAVALGVAGLGLAALTMGSASQTAAAGRGPRRPSSA